MSNDILKIHRMRQVEAAKRYAASDRSDPFAYARAMTHLQNGICRTPDSQHQAAIYDAEPFEETRVLPDGREYHATVYRNVVRP